jgi:diguanylate cyclase (GGDEF)-like protein
MWASIQRTGSWYGEIWDQRKNGEIYPEQLTITAVRGENGEITHYVGTLTDITQRKKVEEQILTLAFYDTLTQLPNRRMLDDRLMQAMASSKRTGEQAAVMFIDLDNFKPLNDIHGHAAGDRLLYEVAMRLKSCMREMDTVARFGGDEFVVILGGLETDKEQARIQAQVVAEKIRQVLSAPYSISLPGEGSPAFAVEHHCTASIGVVLFANHEFSQDEMLKWADIAMYRAKEKGRNQIQFYSEI